MTHETWYRQLTDFLKPSLSSDSALDDHCARLQIIFTYLLTYLQLTQADPTEQSDYQQLTCTAAFDGNDVQCVQAESLKTRDL